MTKMKMDHQFNKKIPKKQIIDYRKGLLLKWIIISMRKIISDFFDMN